MNQRFAEAATVVEAIDKALGRPTPRNEVSAEVKAIQKFLEWATAAAKFAGYKEPDVYAFKPSHFSGYAHANTLGGQSALAKYRNFRSWVFQLP